MLTFEMLEMFASAAGLPELVGAYLGERPLISLQKTTLRKAEPDVPGAWHQDGAFMGDVRALNLWLSLSRCGDESPGLDVVPRRLDQIVATATDDAVLDYQVSQAKAEEAAGDKRITRPIFEPGDALFFDELFLHQTGSDPADAEAALRHRELVLRRLGVPGRVRPDRGLAAFELHDDPSAATAVDDLKAKALGERIQGDHLERGARRAGDRRSQRVEIRVGPHRRERESHSAVQQDAAPGTERGDRVPQGGRAFFRHEAVLPGVRERELVRAPAPHQRLGGQVGLASTTLTPLSRHVAVEHPLSLEGGGRRAAGKCQRRSSARPPARCRPAPHERARCGPNRAVADPTRQATSRTASATENANAAPGPVRPRQAGPERSSRLSHSVPASSSGRHT